MLLIIDIKLLML